MSRLMLVTSRIPDPPAGGRALLSRLHRDCLQAIYGENLVVHELAGEPASGWRSNLRALRGFIDGVTPEAVDKIVVEARARQVDRIFLDGSNLGHLARAAKDRLPGVEVLTFFHNVEARFFLGALKERLSLRGLGVLLANYVAEREAVRHSDRLIALSDRDGRGLAKLYGRRATDILPMAMADRRDARSGGPRRADDGKYALFVGGAFYANQAGIEWFVENVAPHIGMRTCVVGRGLERMRDRLERAGKVEVIGEVERLDEWYFNAHVVIAPIFDGSGMKTKVAESLMYGKRIVGTREAFSGYEDVAGDAGIVCDTKEEFVEALRRLEALDLPAFDHGLRRLYEHRYSYKAALARLSSILG